MNVLAELKRRFAAALSPAVDNPAELVEMVRPSQDAKFGEYQANCAMPLAKQLGRPPRDVASEIVARLDVSDLCQPPEIAGPGFINLRLRDDWLTAVIERALRDERLGVPGAPSPRTYVIDYSGPNVAKPMHVGHIRSTVIGDALYRTLKFLGHRVIGDNHLGDWGTQFGMILYGYKNFVDQEALDRDPVTELARLYRLVRLLVDYYDSQERLPAAEQAVLSAESELARHRQRVPPADPKEAKKAEKVAKQLEKSLAAARETVRDLLAQIAKVADDPQKARLAVEHPQIAQAVLQETAKLHAGDPENLALWQRFLPPCREDIERIYARLGVAFDETLGESFYHDRLAGIVLDLAAHGIARESQGAMAIFLEGYEAPLLIQKQDGAFLYATTDLATIRYRLNRWRPDAILYVVDHRQSLHFEQLFAAARLWGFDGVELVHVSFGTVLGEDGRPFKTRAGDTVGLGGLLDDAVDRAFGVVSANDDAKPNGPELSADERRAVAEAVGIGAIKYADLSQNRASDYTFSYEKMLAMQGNTAAYMQYAHARIRSIFARGEQSLGKAAAGAETVSPISAPISLAHPAERALAVELLRLSEALDAVATDYRPNHLTNYLFDLSNRFSTFYELCPVLKAESPEHKLSRLALCQLTARTIALGLSLLGISVVERM